MKTQAGRTETLDDAEAAMRKLAIVCCDQRETQAGLDRDLVEARSRFEPALKRLAAERAELETQLERFAEANRQEIFGGRQSVELRHGTMSYRLGQPALKLLRGWNWDKITMWLLQHSARYVRTTYAAQKEALLADRDNLALEEMGLRVVQTERFEATPRQERPRE